MSSSPRDKASMVCCSLPTSAAASKAVCCSLSCTWEVQQPFAQHEMM